MKIRYWYNEVDRIYIAAKSRINICGHSPNVAAYLRLEAKISNCFNRQAFSFRGHRGPGFNDLHSQGIKPLGNGELLICAQRYTRRLFTIT